MINHLKSFISFYMVSRTVEIKSCYDLATSIDHILKLNEQGEVRVRKLNDNGFSVVCAGKGPRANILPLFNGRFKEDNQQNILSGEIGLDSGIKWVLIAFCFVIFVFFPLRILFGKVQESFSGASVVAILILLGLLEFAYLIGKNDAKIILRHLNQALGQKSN